MNSSRSNPYAAQRVQMPYGDAFIVNTPAIDRASNLIYTEQKQKEANQAKENAALDDAFSKNLSNIRDADIPDLTSAYGNYKLKWKELQKQGNITPTQQLELLRSKADVDKIISGSTKQKDLEKYQGADVMKNPNKYVRDAHGKLINIMNTPISKMGDTDPFASLPYQGNMSSFNKLLGDATGKVTQGADEVIDNPKELRKDVTHISRFNNAKEYFDKLITGVAGSIQSDDFVRTFGNIPPEQYKQVEQQYTQMLSDPVTRKRLGMDATDLPNDENLKTDVEKTAKFLAMQHQIMKPPILKEGVPIKNQVSIEDRRTARSEQFKIFMQDRSFAHSEKMNKIREAFKNATEEDKVRDVDAFMQDQDNVGRDKVKQLSTIFPSAANSEIYKIDAGPVVLNAFAQKDETTGKVYTPKDIIHTSPNSYKLIGAAKNGGDLDVSRSEYRATLVDYIFNNKVKVNQINTNKTVDGGKKTSSSRSSSSNVISKKTGRFD